MLFFFWGVVAYEIAFTEWNLVIKLVGPRIPYARESLVSVATKHNLLVLDFGTAKNDHILFVRDCSHELFEFSSILSRVGFVLEDLFPFAFLDFLEVIYLVLADLPEVLAKHILLLLVQNVCFQKERIL